LYGDLIFFTSVVVCEAQNCDFLLYNINDFSAKSYII